MRQIDLQMALHEFLTEKPGVYADNQLADLFAVSPTSVKRALRDLRVQDLVVSRVERRRLGGSWWIRRYLEGRRT